MQLQNKRVLIADDVTANRVAIGVLMGQFSFDITQATSGAEAIRLYEEDPSFDVVVLNVEMSGVNGFTVAKLIRQYQRAKRPFVVGFASSPSQCDKALGAGMDFFAIKPFDPEKIAGEVSKLDNVLSFPPRKY